MRIAILVLDDVYLGCVASAQDVVRLITMHRLRRLHEIDPDAPERSRSRVPPVSVEIYSIDGKPVSTSDGSSLGVAGSIFEINHSLDAIFVPAFADISAAAINRRLAGLPDLGPWLGRQSSTSARQWAAASAFRTMASGRSTGTCAG